VLDACVRGAGFRMGPCELMDLIGHDTNFAVTQSVYEANFFDKRFQPSLVQREMVDGGLLGRKSGRGFYRYPESGAKTDDGEAAAATPAVPLVLQPLPMRRPRRSSPRRPPRCCARSAGSRSAWPTCPAWWWRARSRCWSTRPATRWSRACATPPAPTPR
jgi:3-hydroxyacyl-CoA dehydrogenase